MNSEERDLIARFVARVGGQPQAGGGFASSVPATTQSLPPIDPEADAFIGENFQRYPEARYRVTQMAVVQEAALVEAQNRIKRLEWELQNARAQASQPQPQPQQSRGLFGGLFGGGNQQNQQQGYGQGGGQGPNPGYQAGPPPQPSYPPGYNPGVFQRQGSGFLGSALTTAAGVAGGMVVGNALMDMFSGHHDGFGGAAGGFGGGETIINNNYGDAAAGGDGFGGADPWGGAGSGADSFDQAGGFDQGGMDQGGFDQGGGWDDDNSF